MKRGLLAITALLGLVVSHARADYVIIVANGGQKTDARFIGAAGAQGAQGGQAGVAGVAGFVGQGGVAGGPRPPGGMAGGSPFPGGMGGGSPFPGGMGGGSPFPGGAGGGPLPPIGGMMGGMGGGSTFPGGGHGVFGGDHEKEKVNPLRVMVVVEVKKDVRIIPMQVGRFAAALEHKWGKSWLWGKDVEVDLLRLADRRPLPPVARRFDEEFKKVTKD